MASCSPGDKKPVKVWNYEFEWTPGHCIVEDYGP
jgi:hypothetical protein